MNSREDDDNFVSRELQEMYETDQAIHRKEPYKRLRLAGDTPAAQAKPFLLNLGLTAQRGSWERSQLSLHLHRAWVFVPI